MVTYEDWELKIHQRIGNDSVWQFFGYRKALFLYELAWKDCEKLTQDRRGKAIVDQIIRSAGSVSANIEEGYGRGHGKSYAYFLRVAVGSARETKGWYWRSHQLLSPEVVEHRLALLDEIISLIIVEINRQKSRNRK
ncbi:MAG TPA: four helix bundle protein [Chloroflexi bacterium]|nr:four helix bundle protein [Chloroflexota bacterium]